MYQRLDVRGATPDGRQPHRARRRSKTVWWEYAGLTPLEVGRRGPCGAAFRNAVRLEGARRAGGMHRSMAIGKKSGPTPPGDFIP